MSLKIAVEAVLAGLREEMEAQTNTDEGKQYEHSPAVRRMLKGFATQLDIALKAAGDPSPPHPGLLIPGYAEAAFSPRAQIEAAKAEFAGKIKKIGAPLLADDGTSKGKQQLHDSQPRQYEIVGGPAGGNEGVVCYVDIGSDMPVGAHTLVDGAVYTLREDGKLYYDADLSQRYGPTRTAPEGGLILPVEKE